MRTIARPASRDESREMITKIRETFKPVNQCLRLNAQKTQLMDDEANC